MTLLIIALAMTATMGFYAMHLAETEDAKLARLQISWLRSALITLPKLASPSLVLEISVASNLNDRS